MKGTLSNIQELEIHLSTKFKGMLKSKEMKQAGKEAGQAIGRHIGDTANGSNKAGYDYNQSGGFHETLISESKHGGDISQKQSKLTIGMFELKNMTDGHFSKRNFQLQEHVVETVGGRVTKVATFRLKEEKQLPKWIIAEFGTGKHAEPVPSEFKISYTRRDKPYMYGPSLGGVRGEGGGSKRGFFMIGGSKLMNLLGKRAENRRNFREHPGIKAGHVFRDGFRNSKEEVIEILGHGINNYLNNK